MMPDNSGPNLLVVFVLLTAALAQVSAITLVALVAYRLVYRAMPGWLATVISFCSIVGVTILMLVATYFTEFFERSMPYSFATYLTSMIVIGFITTRLTVLGLRCRKHQS